MPNILRFLDCFENKPRLEAKNEMKLNRTRSTKKKKK